MNNQKIEEYIEKIHEQEDNAWESELRARSGSHSKGYYTGLNVAFNQVQSQLRKMLKEEKPVIRIRTPKIKRIGSVLAGVANIKKEV